jgi:hypothetical protein
MSKLRLLFEEYKKALRELAFALVHFVIVKKSSILWTGSMLNSRLFLELYRAQVILPLLSRWRAS